MPVWLRMYVSIWILVPIIGGFLSKAFWIVLGGYLFKFQLKLDVKLRTIGMSFALGFAAEIMAVMYLGIVMILFPQMGVQNAVINVSKVGVISSAIVLNMIVNVLLQMFLLKRVAIAKPIARRLAILIALFTAPWLYLFVKL